MRHAWIVVGALLLLSHRVHGQRSTQVMVGGRAVEVIRMGTGSPTLVLESGAGEGVSGWRRILPRLAQHTSVIAYSRRGHGASAPSAAPGSPTESVEELHALLTALRVRGPILLGGHSFGGLLARLYVSRYPQDVAGLLLVDATHESQFARWGTLEPQFRILDTIRAMLPNLPPAVRDDQRQILEIASTESVPGMRPLPDIPLAIITATQPCAPDREFVCRDPRAIAAWRAMHDEWFAGASVGLRLVSNRTSHYVMNDQPELVIESLRFLLGATRRRQE
jgi:pimeloyl-ACP methyl ester carboxylesterase